MRYQFNTRTLYSRSIARVCLTTLNNTVFKTTKRKNKGVSKSPSKNMNTNKNARLEEK